MNCVIIGGFLGSGKTTFINYLFKTAGETFPEMRTALLINEFGEIPVDASMMDSGSYSIREITGGCICCSLKGMLSEAVAEICERENPDMIIVEATGLAVPSEIAASAEPAGGCSVYTMLCVDPEQYGKFAGKLAIYDRQLSDADMVFLTKADIRSSELMINSAEKLRDGEEFSVNRCVSGKDDALKLLFSCFVDGQAAVPPSRNAEAEYCLNESGAMYDYQKHTLKQDVCQVTHRFEGLVEPVELESRLAGIVCVAGEGLFRIKGIIQTAEGWQAVQFVDGSLTLKAVNAPDGGESFVVFIGMCESIEKIVY